MKVALITGSSRGIGAATAVIAIIVIRRRRRKREIEDALY